MAVTMKNAVFWDVIPCGSSKNRRFEERMGSIIGMERIGEIGTTLSVTNKPKYAAKKYFAAYFGCQLLLSF
jgi:hypothetical protein